MRIPHDIHHDDPAARTMLAEQLMTVERLLYRTPRELDAAWGLAPGTTAAMHKRTTWRAATAQRWARAVGRRLEFRINDIELPDPGDDWTAALLTVADTSTPEREDHIHLLTVCNDLVRARLYAGWTAVAFAEKIGVTENAVHWWQANPEGTTLTALQRYARGLGGSISTLLHAAPVHVVRQRVA